MCVSAVCKHESICVLSAQLMFSPTLQCTNLPGLEIYQLLFDWRNATCRKQLTSLFLMPDMVLFFGSVCSVGSADLSLCQPLENSFRISESGLHQWLILPGLPPAQWPVLLPHCRTGREPAVLGLWWWNINESVLKKRFSCICQGLFDRAESISL